VEKPKKGAAIKKKRVPAKKKPANKNKKIKKK